MIPYQQLRASSLGNSIPISGNSGSNPLGINPIQGNPDLLNDYIYRVRPLLQGDENMRQNMNLRMMNMMRAQQLQDQANARANPNVVYNPSVNGIKPIDAANLAFKQTAEQGKNTRAEEANATKADIAGSTEQGRNTRANAALAEKTQFGQTENQIRQQMANIADYKAKHPGTQFYSPAGGTLHYFDRDSQQMVDTGIDTGKMTDEDKANLGLQNELSKISARGSQTRQTNAAKPTTTKVQSAADKRTQYFNNAQQVANDPGYADDKGNSYVKMGSAGQFTIDPNTPQDLYHQINEKIYGNPAQKDIDLPQDNDPLNILSKDQQQ